MKKIYFVLVLVVGTLILTTTAQGTINVRLNSGTILNCDNYCASFGETCLDAGTDESGTNNKVWRYTTKCTEQSTVGDNCNPVMFYAGEECGDVESHITDWTNCRCESTSSCTYTSGDWEIDCSENCDITSDVDVGDNNIIFSGSGTFSVNADITNASTISISNGCKIEIFSGHKFAI